jgi:hypothetical protein
MTMELSMTIAVGAALAIRECFTATVIVLFVLIAEVLEHKTVGRGRRAIQELTELLPRDATVRSATGERTIALSEIRVGDVVVVKPGARLPVDGEVATATASSSRRPLQESPYRSKRDQGTASLQEQSISPEFFVSWPRGLAGIRPSGGSSRSWRAPRRPGRRSRRSRIAWLAILCTLLSGARCSLLPPRAMHGRLFQLSSSLAPAESPRERR